MITPVLFLLPLGCLLVLQSGPAPCEAKIELEKGPAVLRLTGYCHSLSARPASYRYELLVAKRSPSGQSTSRQSGEFELLPGQTVRLSNITLDAGGAYAGRLRIFTHAGALLARDSVWQDTPTH